MSQPQLWRTWWWIGSTIWPLLAWSSAMSQLSGVHPNGSSSFLLNSIPNADLMNNNDPSLGQDWIDAEGSTSNRTKERNKRALGSNLQNMKLIMTEVASQSISPTEVDYGDSFTFEAVIDLPSVSINNKSDLNIEVFSLDPEEGVAGFHICQAHVEFRGEQLKSIQDEPVYVDNFKVDYPTYVEKVKVIFEQLHTNNQESSDDKNQVQIQFQAVLVDHHQTVSGKKYFITTGVDFGDQAYVWIGQAEIRTSLVKQDYDIKVDFHNPPTSIPKGNAALFSISAFITEPSADLEFGVFQPLGYNDIFHVGQISYTVGNAFACSRPEFWAERYTLSPSGLTVNNASLTYPFLINREAKRDVNNDVNRIQFQVPIHVLNIDTLTHGVTRYLSFGLKIGNKKLWSALQEVTIEKAEDVGAIATPELVRVYLLNNLTSSGRVLAGDSAVFRLEMSASPGWSNFDVELFSKAASPVLPVGTRVIRTGTVAYFPPEWTVAKKLGDNMAHNFGSVKNVDDTNPTLVVLEIVYSTHPSTTEYNDVTIDLRVAGQNIVNSNLTINIAENSNPNDITVEARDFGFDNKLYNGGQTALDLLVTIPSGAGREDLNFEAVADFEVTDFSLRLCRAAILKIGDGLPCVQHSESKIQDVFSKSDDTKPFNDFGNVKIGQSCPLNYPNAPEGSNQFVANLVYELPRGQTVASNTDVRVSGGFRVGNDTIWVSSKVLTTQGSEMGQSGVQNSSLYEDFAGIGVDTLPFLTSYPIITTRGRNSEQFDANEGFFIQYVMKFHPGTRSDYKFKVAPPPNVRICQMAILHIGDNFPCAQPPGPSPTGHENIELVYDTIGSTPNGCGRDAEYTFWGLTNWGREPIISDLTPDEDSIQIVAYFQVCDEALGVPGETVSIAYSLDPHNARTTSMSEITLSGKIKTFTQDRGIEGTVYESLTGPKDIIYKRAPKLIRFSVRVPENYFGDLVLLVNNTHYDEDRPVLDICDLAVVNAGVNIPCVDITKDITKARGPENKVIGSETVHRTLMAIIPNVCYIQVNSLDESSLITFEVAVRVRDLPDGEKVKFTLDVVPAGGFSEALTDHIEVEMTVATAQAGNITVDTLLPDEPKVQPLSNDVIDTPAGEKVWVPFKITLPSEKTVEMEASVLLPSEDGVAIYHATDARFGATNGSNVLCTHEGVHLTSVYPTVFEKTANVSAFMQLDSFTIDLGYVTNAGFTKQQKIHNTSFDDEFVIEVQVQMSDLPSTSNGAKNDIYLAVKFGSIVIVARRTLTAQRNNDRKAEEGEILVDLIQLDPTATYLINDTIEFHAIIYHGNLSKAEGHPGLVRIITPNFLSFTEADYISSNYTLGNGSDLAVMSQNLSQGPIPGYIDITFPHICFADIIELNFSLTADPASKRLVGTGVELAPVVLAPICGRSNVSMFPTTDNVTHCGPWSYTFVSVDAPECYDPIPIFDACQVRASSKLSDLFQPFNSTSTQGVWSPALRDGWGWDDFIEYDFLMVARVNQMIIKNPDVIGSQRFRQVTRVKIQASNVPGYFEDVMEVDIPPDNLITPPQPLEARFVRIVVLKVQNNHGEAKLPIALNGVEWIGCLPLGVVPSVSQCLVDDTTLDASDPTSYRHFAVDDIHDIVYFCDINPHLKDSICYSSIRKEGSNVWQELPRFIGFIEGFSPARGRTYFRDRRGASLLSSLDGIQLELTSTLPTDINPAKGVPGDTPDNIGTVLWAGTQYSATYDGIFHGSSPLIKWSTCCGN